MEHFDEIIDERLAKYLAGECTPGEQEEVARWLAESPVHQKYLDELKWLWEHASGGRTAPPREVDTEKALQQVKNRLRTPGASPVLRIQKGFWLRAAAVFVLAAAAVYWWTQWDAPAPVRIAATGAALTDTLSDGTVLQLAQQSGITLARGFNGRERRLRLQGEAFFQVAHDTTRPFIVEVQDMEVQVVGTAFSVDEAAEPGKVTVTVTEGKVRVSHKGQALLLGPGEQAAYDRAAGSLTRGTAAPEQSGSRLFRFDATPLETVVSQVNRAYGANIILKNKNLEQCRLTATYNNLSFDRVLELIADSFSLKIVKTKEGYVLEGDGCGE